MPSGSVTTHCPSSIAGGFNRSVVVELVAYLQATSHARVGAQVIAPIGLRRHPVDVALDVVSAALLHPGRVALTVGTGEAMNDLNTTGRWPAPGERMERCVEAIELIRRCFAEEGYFRHEGTYFSSFFTLYVKPSPPVPLSCAANGPVLARHAGRLADGICAVGVTPERFRNTILPAFEQGAVDAGRDPSALERIVWVSTSYHPDLAQALAAVRLEAGILVPGAFETVLDPRKLEALGRTSMRRRSGQPAALPAGLARSSRRSCAGSMPARPTSCGAILAPSPTSSRPSRETRCCRG